MALDSNKAPAATIAADDANVTASEYYIKEFEALRAEVVSRLESQTQLTSIALVLLGGILAAVPLVVFSGTQTFKVPEPYIIIGLLVISTLFTSIQWAYMEHDYEMAIIGQYIFQSIRESALQELLPPRFRPSILSWDLYRSGAMFPERKQSTNIIIHAAVFLMSISRYGLVVVPSVVSIVGAGYFLAPSVIGGSLTFGAVWFVIYFVFDVLYVLLTFPYAFFIRRQYVQITRYHNAQAPKN